MGQTVNLLVFTFGGSNPSSPTRSPITFSGFYFQKRSFRASREQWKFIYIAEAQPKNPKISKKFAEVAQLVEHNLAKVGVASSSLVFRSHHEASEIETLRLFLLEIHIWQNLAGMPS